MFLNRVDMGKKHILPDNTKSKARYIEQARKIWDNLYDYTSSNYEGGKKAIIIYCPKHYYYFRVAMAQNHILPQKKGFKPTGCPVCRAEGTYKREFGKDWEEYLEPCAKQSRVKLKSKFQKKRNTKSQKQIAIEKAKREAKQREELDYIERWNAKSMKEARFFEKLQKMYPDCYGTSMVNYQDREIPITLICRKHGEFQITPRALLAKHGKIPPHGCWKCYGLSDPYNKPAKLTPVDIVRKVREKYHIQQGYIYDNMVDIKHNRAVYHCNRHGNISHSIDYWMKDGGCEYCEGKRFWPKDFLKLAHKAQGEGYHYRGIKEISSKSSIVKVHCPNPSHQWHPMLVDLILQGCKCRECASRHEPLEKRRLKFLNDFHLKHGKNHYELTADDYINNDTPIKVRCIIHHYNFKTSPDNLLRGAGGCPYCSASEGEAVILGWLDNHNISNDWHYPIPNEDPTLPLQYIEPDFHLKDPSDEKREMFIEYHGEQHYQDIPFYYKGKRIRNFDVQQHRDRYLREYCNRHNIRLLEIPYWDFDRIYEILTKELL